MRKYRPAHIGVVLLALLVSLNVGPVVKGQSPEILSVWAPLDPDAAQPVVDAYDTRLKAAGRAVQVEYTQVDSADLPAKLAGAAAADNCPISSALTPLANLR